MHPIIVHEVAKARIADWHRQAERDRIARAARPARKPHGRRFMPGGLATGLAPAATGVSTGQAPKATT